MLARKGVHWKNMSEDTLFMNEDTEVYSLAYNLMLYVVLFASWSYLLITVVCSLVLFALFCNFRFTRL